MLTVFGIAAGATLHFDVELLSIDDAKPEQNVFKLVDADADQKISREEMHEYLTQQLEQQKDEMPESQLEEMLQNQVRTLGRCRRTAGQHCDTAADCEPLFVLFPSVTAA